MSFQHFCNRIAERLRIRTRYTRSLEDEVARLRAENRALVNSILGVAGIPPMRLVSAGAVAGRGAVRSGGVTPAGAGAARQQSGPTRMPNGLGVGEQTNPVGAGLKTRSGAAEASPLQHPDNRASVANGAPLVAPLRKRSWQQIGRVREIEDARATRREREANTETFPTPRSVIPRL
ncbi:MAG TPA: hypothetical protein VMV59_04825 [Candidatus Dormibacteraeota bacterium]|nr:hypothetical protein [Candidatus Dormibacteraeota bacterium]